MKNTKMTDLGFVIILGIWASLIPLLAACGVSGGNPLPESVWELTSLLGSDLVPGTTITIEFAADEVAGSGGCNLYGGSYQVSENSLSITEVFSTEMACPEPAGILEQESSYLTALRTVVSYEITDGRLEMFDEAGTPRLTFVAPTSQTLAEEEMPAGTTPNLSLECTLKVDATFPVGEPVSLGFRLRNPTDHALYVLIWYTPLEGMAGDIFQVTRDGAALSYQSLQAKRADPIREEYLAIEPGEAKSAQVDLRNGYDLSTPGSYQVRFTAGLSDVAADESLIPRKRDEHRPQSLICPTVSFDIVPAPEPPTATPTPVPPPATPTPEPPAGSKRYVDPTSGVSLWVPESWAIVEPGPHGGPTILQSYPQEKYVGGEGLQPGDTKCDLTIRPPDIDLEDHMEQLKSDSSLTIVAENQIPLQSGRLGIRIEVESLGRSVSLITEVNERVVVLACFGEIAPFDAIAVTLAASR